MGKLTSADAELVPGIDAGNPLGTAKVVFCSRLLWISLWLWGSIPSLPTGSDAGRTARFRLQTTRGSLSRKAGDRCGTEQVTHALEKM